MPLHWDISHVDKTVTLRTAGALRLDDIVPYLEAVRDAGALGYRKLCDAREGYCDMTEADLMSYLGAVKGLASLGPLGPQALVVTPASVQAHAPMLRMLFVNQDRELRMFTSTEEARNWLQSEPLQLSSEVDAAGHGGN